MSDNNDINFHSGDIKKKKLGFNVEETKSKKAANSFDGFKKKILSTPPLKGNNKFITIGVAITVVVLAVTLPLVLPRVLNPVETEPTPEEQEERQKVKEEVANTINNIDSAASSETQEIILIDLDEKIAASTTDADRYFFIPAKANALLKFGRYEDAINTLIPLQDEYRSKKEWTLLANGYSFLSYIYLESGDKDAALENMKKALATIDEAANDSENPQPIAGRDYYQSQINLMEGS